MDENRELELKAFQDKINYHFNDINLLNHTLTHKSYANELRKFQEVENNERLEFLGDSVLGLIISDFLFKEFPEYPEGELSKIKSYIVSEAALAELARNIQLGDYLLLGKGENQTGGRDKSSILSDAFEALIAGIYIDGKFEKIYEWIITLFKEKIKSFTCGEKIFDYKTQLQEYTQAKLSCIPGYRITSENGPEHERMFEIQLYLNGSYISSGQGKSKKEAEQEAARTGFEKLLALASPEIDNEQTDNQQDESQDSKC
ncbi:MAG: ribonuclease III [bacterium]